MARSARLAGVVLAAGAGTRLAPLTSVLPKPLCPVGNVPLIDHALTRLGACVADDALAVNLHHGAPLLDAHLPPAVHRSLERRVALGTAGALGALRSWLDGRPVLVTNADAWFGPGLDLTEFVDGWDGERTRLLGVAEAERADFGRLRYCGVALIPWRVVAGLAAEPSGLYEVSWRHEAATGRLDLVEHDGSFVDCGTPADYLAANLLGSGGASVIDPTATVQAGATVRRSVVWPNSRVQAPEVLVDAVRAGSITVLVR